MTTTDVLERTRLRCRRQYESRRQFRVALRTPLDVVEFKIRPGTKQFNAGEKISGENFIHVDVGTLECLYGRTNFRDYSLLPKKRFAYVAFVIETVGIIRTNVYIYGYQVRRKCHFAGKQILVPAITSRRYQLNISHTKRPAI